MKRDVPANKVTIVTGASRGIGIAGRHLRD
jgi:short-subunit dehydrogenase